MTPHDHIPKHAKPAEVLTAAGGGAEGDSVVPVHGVSVPRVDQVAVVVVVEPANLAAGLVVGLGSLEGHWSRRHGGGHDSDGQDGDEVEKDHGWLQSNCGLTKGHWGLFILSVVLVLCLRGCHMFAGWDIIVLGHN